MSYQILASGYRASISLLNFDSSSAKLHKVSDSKAPENASWIEPGKDGVVYATSEVPQGEVFSLKFQGEEVKITSKRSAKGEEPAHGACQPSPIVCFRIQVSLMRSGSACPQGRLGRCRGQRKSVLQRLIISLLSYPVAHPQYTGGQVLLYPTEADGSLADSASPPLEFNFPYTKGSAPNTERQDKPHAHHVIEDSKGQIYVCDLGSDRVWVLEKKGKDELAVKGYLQAPEGSGPRHAALSPDGEP